jgi:DHA1 family tetracycline resistance protein-like MFS transporter
MRRTALLVVCLAVFVDMLGFGIILPMLPFQAGHLGGSGGWVGALLTAYAAAQFIAAPVLGSLSDRFGRRRLLLLSLVGSMLSLALTGIADSLVLLLAARVVAGTFGGAIAVGQAYAVDLTRAEAERTGREFQAGDRTRALGLVGASIGLGFVFGPAIGAGLAGLGLTFAGVSFVAAGVAAVNIALGLALLPRAPAPLPGRAIAGGVARRLGTLRAALGRPTLRPVLLAIFAVTFAFAGMETTFALLGAARFGLGPAGLGVVFTYVGVVMVIVQGGLVGRLTDRYGDRTIAVGGAGLLALGLVVLPFAPAWIAFPAMALLAVGQGLLSPTTAALIARAGGPELGVAFGVGQSSAAAARAVGPLVAGLAFDLGAPLPYLLGSLLCLGAVALLRAPNPKIPLTGEISEETQKSHR